MTRILPLSDNGGDPAPVTGQAIVYAKDDGGTVKGYVIADDGTVSELGGGGASGGGSVRVFRPGSGAVGPVIYADFNELYDTLGPALTAGGGQATVYIDDTDESPAVIDPGAGDFTYDFSGVKFVGMRQHGKTFLAINAGSGESDTLVINNMLWFEGLHITSTGNDTAITALQDNQFYLLRTTFECTDQFVVDVLGVTGVKFWLDHESTLLRTSNAAIRVNSAAIEVNLVGNNTRMSNRCLVSGVGGSATVNVYSGSARIESDQLDITMTAINMLTASGYYFADPNTKITAEKGVQVYDPNTGKVWINIDGATAWATSLGTAGYTILDTATEKTVVLASIASVAQGACYAVDWTFKVPPPVAGDQSFTFNIESGDGSVGYAGFGAGGASVANLQYSGRTIITFGAVTGPNQDVLRSGDWMSFDPDDDSIDVRPEYDGPNANPTPIDPSIRVKITLTVAADTGEETYAQAVVSRLA